MTDHEIILAIQELMDGVVWTADIMAEIANLLTDNGYAVGNSEEKQP